MKTNILSATASFCNAGCRALHASAAVGAILALSFVLVGCGSASYQMIKVETAKPVTPLGLKSVTGEFEFTLTGLIVYGGPGSWKKHAYWDEYQVTFVNHGAGPVEITQLILSDVYDREVALGADPWRLEKAGQDQVAYLKGQKTEVTPGSLAHAPKTPIIQTPGSVVAGTAVSAGLASLMYLPAAAVATEAAIYFAPVALVAYSPVYLINRWSVDPKNRKLVMTEFNRRRLKLPVTIEPGATISGSAFFPLTPGPERLLARGCKGESVIEVTIPLSGIEGLHLMYITDKVALKAATLPQGNSDIKRPIPVSNAPSVTLVR